MRGKNSRALLISVIFGLIIGLSSFVSVSAIPLYTVDASSNVSQINNTNEAILLYSQWADNTKGNGNVTDSYIFSWNATSSWANETAAAIQTGNWTNTSKTISTATYEGKVMAFKFYANDTPDGNWNVTSVGTFTILSQAPSVSLSVSPTSGDTGDVITVTCSASDNFGVSSTSISVEKPTGSTRSVSKCGDKYKDTDQVGTYTVTYTASDGVGNSASSSTTFTISAPPERREKRVVTPALPKHTEIIPSIAMGKKATVTLTKEKSDEIGVMTITVEVSNSVNNVKIIVTKLSEKPASVIHEVSGKVYKYVEIDKVNIEDEDISEGKVKFKVEKSWISENNIDEDKVVLNRYTTVWEELPTEKLSDDETYFYYEATTTGFSTFVITGEEVEVPVEEEIPEGEVPTEEVPTEEIPEEEVAPMPIPWGTIGLLVGIVIVAVAIWKFNFLRKLF